MCSHAIVIKEILFFLSNKVLLFFTLLVLFCTVSSERSMLPTTLIWAEFQGMLWQYRPDLRSLTMFPDFRPLLIMLSDQVSNNFCVIQVHIKHGSRGGKCDWIIQSCAYKKNLGRTSVPSLLWGRRNKNLISTTLKVSFMKFRNLVWTLNSFIYVLY